MIKVHTYTLISTAPEHQRTNTELLAHFSLNYSNTPPQDVSQVSTFIWSWAGNQYIGMIAYRPPGPYGASGALPEKQVTYFWKNNIFLVKITLFSRYRISTFETFCGAVLFIWLVKKIIARTLRRLNAKLICPAVDQWCFWCGRWSLRDQGFDFDRQPATRKPSIIRNCDGFSTSKLDGFLRNFVGFKKRKIQKFKNSKLLKFQKFKNSKKSKLLKSLNFQKFKN